MIQQTLESLRINEMRLVDRIARFASLGTTRVAFSEADRRGRELIVTMMKEVGVDTSVDSVSNIIGRRCLLYTSPSPRDGLLSRMPSSA